MTLGASDELESFDFLASYAPGGKVRTEPQGASPSEQDEPLQKWQRRDKGSDGKGRGGPPKRDREQGPPARQGNRGSYHGSRGYDSWLNWASPSDIEQLRHRVSQLERLVIRHEDALNLMRQEVSFIIHFRVGVDSSLVPSIYRAQLGWRELRKSSPDKLDAPLRNVLMNCVVKEFQKRLQQLEEPTSQETRDGLAKAGYLDASVTPWRWRYLQWDPTKRVQVVNNMRGHITHLTVKESLATLAEGLKQTDSLTRFHPLRKLTESMAGDSIGFALQFPFQGELARNMYCAVLELCNCAATQLIAAQIRVDRGQRSSLANAIAKHDASY